LINNKKNNKNIIIGTAQLGENYGVANNNKNFNIKNRIEFLNFAYNNGFINYDTAYAYKNSHKIIGEWLQEKHITPNIYTKLPLLNNSNFEKILSIFTASLKQLNVKRIEGLLLHNPNDWHSNDIKPFVDYVLKNKLIKYFGLSVYSANDIFIDNNIKIIQAPGNIFNQEIFYSDKLNEFNLNNGEIHIRSIFIQGLLLMRPEDIPQKLDALKKPLYYIHNFAKEIKIDVASLAILCVKKLMPNAKIVVGLDSIVQVQNLLNIDNNTMIDSDIEEIIKFGKMNFNRLWDPSNWK
jgi:aryl-alcohol dehydrogenase-like predicted oxidoreductase